METLAAIEKSIHAELVEIWHHLHQHPELSMKEFETANYIEEQLRLARIDRIQRVGKTGIWAELQGRAAARDMDRALALRADIDALPIEETAEVPWRSKVPGTMHACGHDVHTTALLGAVQVLARLRDRIPGKIWFFFQPAEELVQGAQLFLQEKAIDFSKITAIAGIHVNGQLEVGTVSLRAGPVMASTDEIAITINGQGAHAALPHTACDPIVAAATLILQLQTLVSRETNPLESAVLTIGRIQGGTKDNIIPSQVVMEGTLRTLNPDTRARLKSAVLRIAEGVSLSMRVKVIVDYVAGSPPLINDTACTKTAQNALCKLIGSEHVLTGPPTMGGEDFAKYLEKIPGVFMFIGSKTQNSKSAVWHTSDFYTDEAALHTGVLALAGFVLEQLGVEYC
jgi:amidohydrolase/hippurate hydrolase